MKAAEEDLETVAFNKVTPGSHLTFLPDKFKGSTERPEAKPSVCDVRPQIIATCIAHSLVIQAGINLAFSAILLPQLMAPDSTFRVDTDEASWIASLVAIATPVGALVCGPFMDLLGRKKFSLLVTVPLILSWVLLIVTPNSVWFLYLARALAGFGGGMTTVSLVYISEVSHATWRPMLLCLNSVFVSLGILLTNALGVYLPWRVVAGCFCVLAVLSAVAIAIHNPESAHWLLTFHPDSDKHFDQAKQSVQFLYPKHQMFVAEWNRLLSARGQKKQDVRSDGVLTSRLKDIAQEFCKRTSILPFVLLLVIFFFQQLSGTYPIIFYAVQVFQSIGGDFGAGLDANSATILLGALRFGMSVLTTGLSRNYGRRCLMMVSAIGMTVSALAVAIFFQNICVFNSVFNKDQAISNSSAITNSSLAHFQTNSSLPFSNADVSNDSYRMIGLVCVLLFVSFGSVGLLIIPWTLVGEILPTTIRGIGGGMLFAFAYVMMFFIVKVFPFMLDIFQISGLFYFFAVTSFLNVIVVYLFLPETLGKTFDEIEQFFAAKQAMSTST